MAQAFAVSLSVMNCEAVPAESRMGLSARPSYPSLPKSAVKNYLVAEARQFVRNPRVEKNRKQEEISGIKIGRGDRI
jgi:hypothetical protein